MEVISYFMGGNSFPIVVRHQQQKKLVKLRAGLSGGHASVSEWFGNIVGDFLGIYTRQPYWIFLPDDLVYDKMYIEVKDLIEKSLGVNIAFDFIENAQSVQSHDLKSLDISQYVDVFLFDVIMLNIDRTKSHPNMLMDNDKRIIVSDFDASLLFNELLSGSNLQHNSRVLQCLKEHPFYQIVSSDKIADFLSNLNNVDFKSIIETIPDDILELQFKSQILEVIAQRVRDDWQLKELLENISVTRVESELERNRRIRQNREQLERRVRLQG